MASSVYLSHFKTHILQSCTRGLSRCCVCCSGKYRYELQNRLAFGAILRQPAEKLQKRPLPEPPAVVTVVSETGFPSTRMAAVARHKVTKLRRATTQSSAPLPENTKCDASEPTAQSSPKAAPLAPAEHMPRSGSSDSPAPSWLCSELATSSPREHMKSSSGPPLSTDSPLARLSTTENTSKFGELPGYMYNTSAAEDPQPDSSSVPQLPSVTRILQATMSEQSRAALKRWERKMVLQHGQDGFERIKQEMFETGRQLHEAVHSYLLGTQQPAISPSTEPFWESVWPVLSHVDTCHVSAAEKRVRHEQLGYAGVVDCVVPFRSTPMVIEWKTARRPKPQLADLYDNPVQTAAYIGAYNFSHRQAQVSGGAVVVAYDTGQPATVHVLGPAALQRFWSLWLTRLLQYKTTAT